MSFRELLGKELLFFDGATGTMLQALGLQPGELPELWNFTHAEKVQSVHEAYLNNGSNIIKSNTFGANRLKFKGTDVTVDAVVGAALKIGKAACAGREKAFVALNLGPTGKLLAPYGDLPFEEAVDIYGEMVRSGAKHGADLILIETMSDTYEIKAAILAAKENSDLPIIVTLTFDEDGKLLTGADVLSAVAMVEGLGVDAVGFNCGLGPKQMGKLLPQLLAACSLPVVLNPNAGLPVQRDGQTVFDVGADDFAELMRDLVPLGISVVGGCCGTTPAHIKALIEKCRGLQPGGKRDCQLTVVSSYGRAVVIDRDPVIIGERINPTGKPRLKQAILDGDLDYICRLGLEQLDNDAHILDVNVGVPGIDEAATAAKTVLALQAITSAPLQIDTSDYETMERALRLYNGKPLLNSVSGKDEALEKVLPLAKKYGAVVVGLALDDTGITETAAGRLAVAAKIIDRAAAYGIEKRNIIIDPLALTISTGPDNASVDLEVIRALAAQNVKTIMGVSNISFGLPARDAANSTFFALALEAGLSCAIINPQSKPMLDAYYAFRALKGMDEGCKAYVKRFADGGAKTQPPAVSEYTLYDAITKGLQEQSRQAVTKLLASEKPLDIINSHMIPALDFVGNGFEKKSLFLPQLLMSADAAKAAFDVIRDRMAEGGAVEKGAAVIIATVKGDIHDIGKNIVKVLLENYGYNVIDLGKDVPVEAVVEAVAAHQAHIVGLSALMTTTVGAMEATIKALRDTCRDCDCKIVVGGAVLTQDYADSIGADHYAPNAVSAVAYVNGILEK
ncbi:homocysteine S-methyltransferase family protein [uncultured Phascolarctobacterium sp.]|uniref:homocysteine S-methyltransferase family protein n=1 Tax=Phascolarctobacterium sp. TaxID=2049039 RepID=UPI0025FE6B2C|nr:homocysteine S-methyltransferase family protein [uncultured Phascolarctobacterium sp.]